MFDEFTMELAEVIEAGDGLGVAVQRFGGRARCSLIKTDQVIGDVFSDRNGKIARGREYATRDQALEAVGCRSSRRLT